MGQVGFRASHMKEDDKGQSDGSPQQGGEFKAQDAAAIARETGSFTYQKRLATVLSIIEMAAQEGKTSTNMHKSYVNDFVAEELRRRGFVAYKKGFFKPKFHISWKHK